MNYLIKGTFIVWGCNTLQDHTINIETELLVYQNPDTGLFEVLWTDLATDQDIVLQIAPFYGKCIVKELGLPTLLN